MTDVVKDRLVAVLGVASANAASVDREARFPKETVEALAKSGLLGLTIPEASGGIGGGPVEFFEVLRALAANCASSSMVYLMHICSVQVAQAGGASADALQGMAGSGLATLAFSERGSRSHFWAPVSIPVEAGGGTSLAAKKSFVTSAGQASTYVVSTRQTGADSPLASTLYLVPATAGGIKTEGPWVGLGLRGNASGPMTFDTSLGEASILGEDGKGLDLMLGIVLPWFQLGQGAVSLGIAEGAMAATVQHITSARLEHLDQTLADLPTVRARVGRAQTEIDGVAGFLHNLAGRLAAGDATAPVLSAKAVANEMAIKVTSELMQACGGAGMSSALPIERYFRDARAGSVMAPTTDVLYELTGRALAGMPLL